MESCVCNLSVISFSDRIPVCFFLKFCEVRFVGLVMRSTYSELFLIASCFRIVDIEDREMIADIPKKYSLKLFSI